MEHGQKPKPQQSPLHKKKQLNKRIKNSIKGLLWWFSGWDSKLPMQKMWVQFLVRELGSYKPCSTVRKKKKKKSCSSGKLLDKVTKSKKEKRATADKTAG